MLAGADLGEADLIGANFCRTDLYEIKLPKARLINANLQGVQLSKTDFEGAWLIGFKVYGMSAWDINLKDAVQKDLISFYTHRTHGGQYMKYNLKESNANEPPPHSVRNLCATR